MIKTLQFKKYDNVELRKVYVVKEFRLSMGNRTWNTQGVVDPLVIEYSIEERVKASLSELDCPSIRVKICSDSKIPTTKGWLRLDEQVSIGDMLSDKNRLNYSLKTGEVLGEGIHLIVINLKESTFKNIAVKLIEEF
jgi:hypothetical protein